MDDPSLADITRTDNPALQGYQFAGTESPVVAALRAKLTPDQFQNVQYGNIGPGGKSPIGTALAWTPYDPNQQLFDPHQHYGATVDDPTYGKLQSMWTEPSKSANDYWHKGLGPTLFGAALSAITMGAASPFLGPAFSALTKYGSGGGFDPKSLALSFALSQVPGALGGISPSLAQAYDVGSKGLGVYNAADAARRGNYTPVAGIGLNQLTQGLG